MSTDAGKFQLLLRISGAKEMQFADKWRTKSEEVLVNVESKVDIPLEDRIVALDRVHASVLIAAMLEFKPTRTLEVGLGYGFSAACIQAAGGRDHTIVSIDMNLSRQSFGVRNANEFGSPRLLQGPSDTVLASLIASERESFELVLIDGGHTFDSAFVDLHFARQLCSIGGIILIDDTWMPSIQTLCSWIDSNLTMLKRVASLQCIAVYQNHGGDTRSWNHWMPFAIATAEPASTQN